MSTIENIPASGNRYDLRGPDRTPRAVSSREPRADETDRFVVAATAALAARTGDIAIIFGDLGDHARIPGWIDP